MSTEKKKPPCCHHVAIIDLINYLDYYLTIMITINIHEAKTRLSHYLDEVEKGERIILCKRNKPIAEIRHISNPLKSKRPFGLAKTGFSVPPAFFDELPDEVIGQFETCL